MWNLIRIAVTRTAVGTWLGKIPFVRRAYDQYYWSRKMNAFSGVYQTYESAAAACEMDHHRVGWNDADLAQNLVTDDVPRRRSLGDAGEFKAADKPVFVGQTSTFAVLLWLSKLVKPGCRIVDVGGAGGIVYCQYRDYFKLPDGATWTVVDMPETVARGRAAAERAGTTELTFETDLAAIKACDILISSGCIQYMPPEGFAKFCKLSELAYAVIINKIALVDRPNYWSRQSFVSTSSPYLFANGRQFIQIFTDSGLKLKDCWHVPEITCDIAFAPRHRLSQTTGVVFVR